MFHRHIRIKIYSKAMFLGRFFYSSCFVASVKQKTSVIGFSWKRKIEPSFLIYMYILQPSRTHAMSIKMEVFYLLYARLVQGASQDLGVVLVVSDKLIQSGKGDLIRHEVSTNGRALNTEMEDIGFTPGCETSSKFVR